jgi:RHS repeat-associated protein
VVTNYVYDRLNPVQEKAGATVTANLLTGLGIDEFFTRTDEVGVRALLPDALGSTVALGNSTGTLQTQYTYEPFGYATITGAVSTSSYKYTGREDNSTGLYYYRARYYSPRFQRFITEDPIGFLGGINLYAYVRNAPLVFTDPLGLEPGQPFPSSDLAAIDAIDCICGKPKKKQRFEWGGYIYQRGPSYYASEPRTDNFSYKVAPGTPSGPDVTAEYHTHNSVNGTNTPSYPNDYHDSRTGEPFTNYIGLPNCKTVLKYVPGLGVIPIR